MKFDSRHSIEHARFLRYKRPYFFLKKMFLSGYHEAVNLSIGFEFQLDISKRSGEDTLCEDSISTPASLVWRH